MIFLEGCHMKLREIMTREVIRIHPEEPVSVAARSLARYNIGCLPVCGSDGRLCGVVTDRDLVTRCLAAGKNPATTRVSQVMTKNLVTVAPDTDVDLAAALMGRRQVRRLPVVENGRLCGMVSLGDIAQEPSSGYDAGDALGNISSNITSC